MTYINVNTYIIAHLASYPAITALAGARIWQGEQPTGNYTPADGAAITFQFVGGIIDFNDALQLPLLIVDCWASTPLASYQLYLQVLEALDCKSSAYLQHSIVETLGETVRHPDTGWPFTTSSYRVWILKETEA